MSRKTGFTLIELLVVVAIIAVLIAIIMPTVNRAREQAKKAVCSMQLRAYGVGIGNYTAAYRYYPHMGTGGRDGWPKFNGVLSVMGIPGTGRVNGLEDYQWELDEIWEKALCPSLNAPRLWKHIEDAPPGGCEAKASLHPASISYQWNVTLRYPAGQRYPAALCSGFWENSYWIDFQIWLSDNQRYITQAAHPGEVDNPGMVAEAWDGCDVGVAPNVSYGANWNMENLAPGWHVGPECYRTNGWAMLSAVRHQGSPNILYVDGSVRADATRKLRPSDLHACPHGSWEDMRTTSWPDYDETFGTMSHIIPQCKIIDAPLK